jgi:hypothetical protein
MNYLGDGQLVAKIEGTKKKLYVSGEDDDGKKELILTGNQKFQVTFDPDTERQIFAVFGSSGSGKSYFARQLLKEYNELHKKSNIYLFSPVVDDKSLETVKNLCKIDISNPEFLSEEITLDDLKDSCVLFDDTESISNKMVNKKVQTLAEMLLERGRHHNISVIFLNHTPCNGKQTKKILMESHAITIFLKTLGGRNLKYLLESYLSLSKEQIKIVKGMKRDGRALTFVKSYPMVAIAEKRAVILEDD